MDSYGCTHCGHGFQSEKMEKECPECFWSSSLLKNTDLAEVQRVAIKNQKMEADLTKIGGTALVVFGFICRTVFFIGLGLYLYTLFSAFGDTPFSQLTAIKLIQIVFGLGGVIYCAVSIFKPVNAISESDYDYKLLYGGWGVAGLAVVGIGVALFYIFHGKGAT